MRTQLGMFAKHWTPGAVKTRLAATIGQVAAASFHRLFVQTLLIRFQEIADRQVLCFTPADSAESFRQLKLGSWTLEPQAHGDLGVRMQEYFARAFSHAETLRTVLIGSDSPDLPLDYVQVAFEKLQEFPVVLGPTTDGGYYLIGLSHTVPPIFNQIPWSTPEVWPQTTSRLARAQIPYHVLPEWYDVDDVGGLNALLLQLNNDRTSDSHLRLMQSEILAALSKP